MKILNKVIQKIFIQFIIRIFFNKFMRSQSPSPKSSRSPTLVSHKSRSKSKSLDFQKIINFLKDEYVFNILFLVYSFFLGIADPRLYIVTIGCLIEFLRDNKKFCTQLKNTLSVNFDVFCMIFYIFLCLSFLMAALSAICFFIAYYLYTKNRSNITITIILGFIGAVFATSNIFIDVPICVFILRYFLRNKVKIIQFLHDYSGGLI